MTDIRITSDNKSPTLTDKQFTVKCPHCGIHSGLSLVSVPQFEHIKRYELKRVAIGFKCDACSEPIVLKFTVQHIAGDFARLDREYQELERASETYDFTYLPVTVADDFREALSCYSIGCNNAFASMCRRVAQSSATELGAEGSTKVQNQLAEVKRMGAIDDAVYEQLIAVMITGHDGAHPHLPSVTPERSTVLLEIVKDVLYQLFVRPGKIREASALRKQVIAEA